MVGTPASLEQALAEEVRRHKAGDPLAPVTILVGNTLLRPYLRRRLAELLGGWINIEFLTFADLGEKLGLMAQLTEGRMPMPALAEQVLVRQVAAGARGYFKPVAEAPGLPPALQRLFKELGQAEVEPQALAEADPGDKVKELADLFQQYRTRRAGYYDSFDCLVSADPARLGSRVLLVHGVWQMTAVQRRVLEQLMAVADLTFFLPETGTDADFAHEEMRAWLARVGIDPERLEVQTSPETALDHLREHVFATNGPATQDDSVRLLSAPDAPREVVEAARACLEWARDGIAFHEMAVAYRHDEPYRALVESIFDDSGIPIYLHDGTPLVERPLGRRALALLDLIDAPRPLLRSAVMEFLTDAHLPEATREQFSPRPARWDDVSRRAGIVEGREQWRERLRTYIEEQERRSAEHEASKEDEQEEPEPEQGEGEEKRNRYQWRKHHAENLARFAEDLAERLEARPDRAPWSAQLAYLRDLFATYIDGVEPIIDELARLAQLDDVSDEVGFEQFRAVVRQAITEMRAEDPPGKQRGSFGYQGVNVLDVNSLRHLRFRAVVVLGLSERSFPPPPRQDALLLDHERAALNERRGWEIPLRAGGPDQEPLQFALAIHAAAERLQLSFARTELGDQRAKLPSHFFRAAAAALIGEPVSVERVETGRLPDHLFTRIPGSRFAAPSPQQALTASEYDRTLLTGDAEQRALGLAVVSKLKPELERSRLAYTSRWHSRTLTTYDGLLGEPSRGALVERGGLERVLSASTIETYATCPYRYFLSRVLRIRTEDEPDRIERISPLERGRLVHRILEHFLIATRGRRPAKRHGARAPPEAAARDRRRAVLRLAATRPHRPCGAVAVRPRPHLAGPRALVRRGAGADRALRPRPLRAPVRLRRRGRRRAGTARDRGR